MKINHQQYFLKILKLYKSNHLINFKKIINTHKYM